MSQANNTITIKDINAKVETYKAELTDAEWRKVDLYDWYVTANQRAVNELREASANINVPNAVY